MTIDTITPTRKTLYTFSTLRHLTESSFSNSLAQSLIHKNMDYHAALKAIKESQKDLQKAEEQCKKYLALAPTSLVTL